MKTRNKLLRIALPVAILIAGIIGMKILGSMRKAPPKTHPESPGILADVMEVRRADHVTKVYATGTVQPARKASIARQVSGRITWISPRMGTGGMFKKGERLLEIERRDYEIAVQKAGAAVAKARLELETAAGEAEVAREQWKRVYKEAKTPPSPLVFHEPQLENARAALKSAMATLRQAELDLERTTLYAPFNCAVQSEEVEKGQYVRSGEAIATLIGTDEVEVLVPVSLADLSWITASPRGSRATVSLKVGERTFRWHGRVIRTLKDVDPQGRMPRVVVSVSDPYQLSSRTSGRPDLAPGLLVDVEIQGRTIHKAFCVPATAMRGQDTIWTADREDRLHIQPVTVLRWERDRVFLRADIRDGTRVILTNISGAAEGLRLRPSVKEVMP